MRILAYISIACLGFTNAHTCEDYSELNSPPQNTVNEEHKHKDYWNNYYLNAKNPPPSTFAEFVVESGYIKEGMKIIDIGCGEARDTFYFINKGYDTFGIDFSETVIKNNKELAVVKGIRNDVFSCVDVNDTDKLITDYSDYDVVYARFFIHTLTEKDQQGFLKYLGRLKSNSLIFLEFLTDKDSLLQQSTKISSNEGKTDHYRRLVNFEAFSKTMDSLGFNPLYQIEAKDLSTGYNDDNPFLGRLICQVKDKNSSLINLDSFSALEKERIIKSELFSHPYLTHSLYELMAFVDIAFRKNGIKYWAMFGTLLGAERHGSIVPWDDDLDIAMLIEDREKLEKLQPLFNKYGYEFYRPTFGSDDYVMKISPRNAPISYYGAQEPNSPFLDIIFFTKDGKDLRIAHPGVFNMCPQHHPLFKVDEVEVLERKKFGLIEIDTPKYAYRHLVRFYGPDYLRVGKFDHLHLCQGLYPFTKVRNRYIFSLDQDVIDYSYHLSPVKNAQIEEFQD